MSAYIYDRMQPPTTSEVPQSSARAPAPSYFFDLGHHTHPLPFAAGWDEFKVHVPAVCR